MGGALFLLGVICYNLQNSSARGVKMILYVVRHGETDFNVQERYAGSTDVPLNKKGLEQAGQLARELVKVSFDIIVTSSLIRAKQTAEIISKIKGTPIVISEGFTERNVGVYEGLTRKEAKEKYPELWEKGSTRLIDDAPTGGETIRQFEERITAALVEIEKRYASKRVLLVTHAFASRIINRHYKNLTYDEMHEFSLGNCEIAEYAV
jgi:probable phosphoglycerate mutase